MQLTVIYGPMFSGKTEELIKLYERRGHASMQMVAVKPSSDTRHPSDVIVSHSGRWVPAVPVSDMSSLLDSIAEIGTIYVDEVQFFDPDMVDALIVKAAEGIQVVAAGLDLDFRRQAFPATAELASRATSVVPKTAICSRCGRAATVTQRLEGGRPASLDDSVFLVGDAGLYEPRCEACWNLERHGAG